MSARQLLVVYRAALLLAVAANSGPVPVETTNSEKARSPDYGSAFDVFYSAKNGLRASVVTIEHSASRCAELCLADAFDAVAKFERENDLDCDFMRAATNAMQADVALSADPEKLTFNEPLWPPLVEFPLMDRTFSGVKNLPPQGSNNGAGSSFLFSEFWRDWYWGIISGDPLNWELQRKVAEIPDDFWETGPEAVAQRIEEIKADFLADKAPLAEAVELNPETGRFRVVPIQVQNPALLGAMIARTEDAIEDALHGPNGLREDSHEVRKLNRTHTRYANDPQRVEMDYTSVAVSLRRQIRETGELADSEDNLALLEAVEEGALAIRAQHPEVAENRNIIAAQKLRELAPENIELLEDALPLLEEISEGAMREDFAKDIPKLINDATLPLPTGAPPLPGADEATRIFSRVAKMSKLYRAMYEQGADIFDSKQFKTVRLGLTVGGALTALITFGIRLFGPL